MISKKEAHEILEEVVATRNSSEHPFQENWESEFRAHSKNVAEIASKIAEKAGLDSQKAYVLGYLHDAGKIKDEKAYGTYHGLVGYELFKEKGWDELAKISLTHTMLPEIYEIYKKFGEQRFPWPEFAVNEINELLQGCELDDYDRLLQLADMIDDRGYVCVIEERFGSAAKRYGVPENLVGELMDYFNSIRAYFDAKCGCNVYELIGVN